MSGDLRTSGLHAHNFRSRAFLPNQNALRDQIKFTVELTHKSVFRFLIHSEGTCDLPIDFIDSESTESERTWKTHRKELEAELRGRRNNRFFPDKLVAELEKAGLMDPTVPLSKFLQVLGC